MQENYFRGESPKKDMGFTLSMIGLLFFTIMGIGIDSDQFLQQRAGDIVNIPDWYFYLIFFIDAIIILSIVLIYFYRKIGVILFPLFTLLHFLVHMYYLETFLYSDVTSLFMFVGIALLAIIPKWQFFR